MSVQQQSKLTQNKQLDADKITRQHFHSYLYDYLQKQGYQSAARAFLSECDPKVSNNGNGDSGMLTSNGIGGKKGNSAKQDPLPAVHLKFDMEGGFLFDWFVAWWDLHEAQNKIGGSDNANNYIGAIQRSRQSLPQNQLIMTRQPSATAQQQSQPGNAGNVQQSPMPNSYIRQGVVGSSQQSNGMGVQIDNGTNADNVMMVGVNGRTQMQKQSMLPSQPRRYQQPQPQLGAAQIQQIQNKPGVVAPGQQNQSRTSVKIEGTQGSPEMSPPAPQSPSKRQKVDVDAQPQNGHIVQKQQQPMNPSIVQRNMVNRMPANTLQMGSYHEGMRNIQSGMFLKQQVPVNTPQSPTTAQSQSPLMNPGQNTLRQGSPIVRNAQSGPMSPAISAQMGNGMPEQAMIDPKQRNFMAQRMQAVPQNATAMSPRMQQNMGQVQQVPNNRTTPNMSTQPLPSPSIVASNNAQPMGSISQPGSVNVQQQFSTTATSASLVQQDIMMQGNNAAMEHLKPTQTELEKKIVGMSQQPNSMNPMMGIQGVQNSMMRNTIPAPRPTIMRHPQMIIGNTIVAPNMMSGTMPQMNIGMGQVPPGSMQFTRPTLIMQQQHNQNNIVRMQMLKQGQSFQGMLPAQQQQPMGYAQANFMPQTAALAGPGTLQNQRPLRSPAQKIPGAVTAVVAAVAAQISDKPVNTKGGKKNNTNGSTNTQTVSTPTASTSPIVTQNQKSPQPPQPPQLGAQPQAASATVNQPPNTPQILQQNTQQSPSAGAGGNAIFQINAMDDMNANQDTTDIFPMFTSGDGENDPIFDIMNWDDDPANLDMLDNNYLTNSAASVGGEGDM